MMTEAEINRLHTMWMSDDKEMVDLSRIVFLESNGTFEEYKRIIEGHYKTEYKDEFVFQKAVEEAKVFFGLKK